MDAVDELAAESWISCRTRADRLRDDEAAALVTRLGAGWEIVGGHHLRKCFGFPDFATGLAFVDCLGALAEATDHHPDLALRWGEVTVEIWTHVADGLGRADFVWAARAEQLARGG